MAFWNRKKTTDSSVVNVSSLIDKETLDKLEESIRLLIENNRQNSSDLIRSNQDLTKALNAATREFKKTR